MTFASVIALIPALIKFWDEVTQLIKVLQTTPEQNHQALMTSLQKEADSYAQTGRPTWG